MQKGKKLLTFALVLPIVLLLGFVLHKEYRVHAGHEVTLPIHGYNLQKLLETHSLDYTVDYQLPGLCKMNYHGEPCFVCLQPRQFSYLSPSACTLFIRGYCQNQHFYAGIEHVAVSKREALKLAKTPIKNQNASIVVSVSDDGYAHVKHLLIDGKSWPVRRH